MADIKFIFAVSKSSDGKWEHEGKELPRIGVRKAIKCFAGVNFFLGAYSILIGKGREGQTSLPPSR